MKRAAPGSLFAAATAAVLLAACVAGGGGEAAAPPTVDMTGTWEVAASARSGTCAGGTLDPPAAFVLVFEQDGSALRATDSRGASYSGSISGNEFLLAGGWSEDRGGGCIAAIASAIHGTAASAGTFSATDTLVLAPADPDGCPGLSACVRTDDLDGFRPASASG